MRDSEVLVCFRPSGREAYVLSGTRLVEAAAEAGIVLESPCGGEGLCGKCRVIVASGAGEPTAADRDQFSAEELKAGWRLACQSTVGGPMEVEIPLASRVGAEHKILVHTAGEKVEKASGTISPIRKQYVELPPPARGDDVADGLRLERAIGSGTAARGWERPAGSAGAAVLKIDVSLLRELPASSVRPGSAAPPCLRKWAWAPLPDTPAVAHFYRAHTSLLDFEPGNTEAEAYAVAVDVGTTPWSARFGPGHGQPEGGRRRA